MRPMDLFTEKQQLRDTRTDQQACKSLLNESLRLATMAAAAGTLTEGDIRAIKREFADEQSSQRDKFALASIAFCSPLMMLGMGATMALMDDMKLGRISKLENSLRNRVQFQQRDLQAEAARESSRNLKQAVEPLKPFDEQKAKNEKGLVEEKSPEAKKKLKDAQEPPQEASRPIERAPKDRLKLKKLLKEKQALTDYMEQMRGKLSLKSVSNIMARLEQLDKQLKKMDA